MKFCLNSRVAPEYLRKADQIKINYRDLKSLPNFLDEYGEREFILEFTQPMGDDDFKLIQQYNKVMKIICCLFSFEDIFKFSLRENNIQFYSGFPAESFTTAQALKYNGVKYIRPSGDLFFSIDILKNLGVPVRYTPNRAWLSVYPRENGVCGTWIRPEDLNMYDSIPDSVVEFENVKPTAEEALYRVYAEDHKWPGELQMIVQDLNVSGFNRMIPSETSGIRLNCSQKCMKGYNCHVCPNTFNLMSKLNKKEI